MTLPRAEHAPELLDQSDHDPRELLQSLRHVAQVNRWLGGGRALMHHLAPMLDPHRTTRILDVGTGSADLPRHIVAWARKHEREVRVVATDVHPQMREIAADACAAFPEISVQTADALALPFDDNSFDVAIISLTLHHFEQEQQLRVLCELARVSQRAVIVNELARTRLNYLGARLLSATLWRRNRLTRHDGPLSVLRAFTPDELAAIARRAGLRGRVSMMFFQRLVLVAAKVAS